MGHTDRKSKTDTTALLRRIQDRLSTRLKLERDRTANLSFVSSFICAADGRSLHGHHGHRYARRILPSAACDRKDEFAPDACCRRSDSRNRDRRCGHCFQDAPHRLQQAQALRQEPQSRTSTPQSAFRRQRGHESHATIPLVRRRRPRSGNRHGAQMTVIQNLRTSMSVSQNIASQLHIR